MFTSCSTFFQDLNSKVINDAVCTNPDKLLLLLIWILFIKQGNRLGSSLENRPIWQLYSYLLVIFILEYTQVLGFDLHPLLQFVFDKVVIGFFVMQDAVEHIADL